MVTVDHLHRVAERLTAEPPFHGWPVQWLDQPGTIYLAAPSGAEVYATPGWDGSQTLVVQVMAPDASDLGQIEIDVAWTGDVDHDVKLWRETLEEHWPQIRAILMRYRSARFMMDDGPTFEGWTNGTVWNGWQCPRFEQSETERLAAFLNTRPEGFFVQSATVTAAGLIIVWEDGKTDLYPRETIETTEGKRETFNLSFLCWWLDE